MLSRMWACSALFLIGCNAPAPAVSQLTPETTAAEPAEPVDNHPCAQLPPNNPSNTIWCVGISGTGSYDIHMYLNPGMTNGIPDMATNQIELDGEVVSEGSPKIYSLEGPQKYFTTHNGVDYQHLLHVSGSFEYVLYKNQVLTVYGDLTGSFANWVME